MELDVLDRCIREAVDAAGFVASEDGLALRWQLEKDIIACAMGLRTAIVFDAPHVNPRRAMGAVTEQLRVRPPPFRARAGGLPRHPRTPGRSAPRRHTAFPTPSRWPGARHPPQTPQSPPSQVRRRRRRAYHLPRAARHLQEAVSVVRRPRRPGRAALGDA